MQANEWTTSAFKKWSIALLSKFLYLFPVMLLIPSRFSWLTFLVIRVHVTSLPNTLFLVVVHQWAEVREHFPTNIFQNSGILQQLIHNEWFFFSTKVKFKKMKFTVKYFSSETHEGRVTKPLVMFCLLIEGRMQQCAVKRWPYFPIYPI